MNEGDNQHASHSENTELHITHQVPKWRKITFLNILQITLNYWEKEKATGKKFGSWTEKNRVGFMKFDLKILSSKLNKSAPHLKPPCLMDYHFGKIQH